MEKLILFSFFLLLIILLVSCVNAQYESISGIETTSQEYESYKSCVDSCEQCELNCKGSLLQQAAESKQDESFCLQMADEARKTFCLDNTYRIKAFTQKDKSFCDKISNEDEKQRCTLSVQIENAIEKENEAECNSLPEDSITSCKISFYNSMAIQKQDKSFCNNLQEPAKSTCISAAEATTEFTTTAASDIQEATEGVKEKVSTNVTKVITYGSIGVGAILLIILAIFLITKLTGKKKPSQETPLVVQQQQTQAQTMIQQKPMGEQKK